MEYTTLGDTGTTVSKLCLWCMSFGDPRWREWVLGEEAGKELVDRAIERTMRTLDDAVCREKTRYLGASSMWAHQRRPSASPSGKD